METTIGTRASNALGADLTRNHITMESYHQSETDATGAHGTLRPRHLSIVVINPPITSAPLAWTAEDDDLFCRIIDALPTVAAQHCAAVLYDLLFDFEQQRIITSVCRFPIALIAGVAGYSKAAMWRSLPILARAGLLTWAHAETGNVTLQLTPPNLASAPALSVARSLAMPVRASIIPPSLRRLALNGDIALDVADGKQRITVLRSGTEAGHA